MVTRNDVAKKAGVSPSTVSRVINNNGYVATDVRLRIMQAIDELNYVPSRIANMLRSQKSSQIACVTHSIANPFYNEILLGIEETAYENSYSFSLFNANFEQYDYKRAIRESMFDGLIVLSPAELTKLMNASLLAEELPTVVYWDYSGETSFPHVFVDMEKAMETSVSYLLENGHRQILFLSYEFMTPEENPRFQGYISALAKHRQTLDARMVVMCKRWDDTLASGYAKMKEFLQTSIPFTAIAATNDLLAIGAMRALSEAGMRVPQDVSVTGFDDVDISSYIAPPLTTVHVPKRQIGQELVTMLFDKMAEKQVNTKLTMPTQLIIRESVTHL